jgi:hypothetical protein
MKTQLNKAALLVAIGLVGASAVRAESFDDLVIGFTTGSGNDSIYDLGSFSGLDGGTPLFNGETWSASTLGITSGSYSWGVIGSGSAALQGTSFDTLYTTIISGLPGTLAGNSAWNSANTGINTLVNQLPGGAAGFGPGGLASLQESSAGSWNTETISGPLTTDFHNAYGNPNGSGPSALNIYSINDNGSAPTLDGTFTLGGDGTLTFNTVAVPEPGTGSLLAGAGLLAVCFRNQFRRKNA